MGEGKKEQEKLNKDATGKIIFLIILCILLVGIIVAGVWIQNLRSLPDTSREGYNTYDKHVVLITDEGNEAFWESVYNSALEEGKENGVFVERFGQNLAVRYSKNQLLEMAIQASVDGIIVEGDDSEETVSLIDRAVADGIPVITIVSDCSGSSRQGYVGINSYNIGTAYGTQMLKLLEENPDESNRVLVVSNQEGESASLNLVLLGIRETLGEKFSEDEISVDTAVIGIDDTFAVEEYMRELFLYKEKFPKVLVCLDSIATSQAYQAAVDYNSVGDCYILGYYDSDVILSAVSKGVISQTLSLDTVQMGKMAVEAFCDYSETGYMNGYMAVDMRMIDKSTADAMLSEESEVEP